MKLVERKIEDDFRVVILELEGSEGYLGWNIV